jgi:tRNA (guanine-N7-)-methyltransferase
LAVERTSPSILLGTSTRAWQTSAVRGVRQHVNPLASYYLEPRANAIAIPERFRERGRVEVELGCADAQFSFDLAESAPETFVVGLEIRRALVERNTIRAQRRGLENLAFGYVNLNVDLDRVFAPRSVDRFHLLFPDPWFKKRQQKRRVVDLAWCTTICQQLKAGGEIHVATDIFEVGLEALEELETIACQALGLTNLAGPWRFSRENPCAQKSRRECTTLARGQRVWRLRFGFSG